MGTQELGFFPSISGMKIAMDFRQKSIEEEECHKGVFF